MPKKIPMRQCLGCREMKAKIELVRVVKAPTGEVQVDHGGKLPGRGAYVCARQACLKKALKSKALERAFHAPIPEDVHEALVSSMEVEHGT